MNDTAFPENFTIKLSNYVSLILKVTYLDFTILIE